MCIIHTECTATAKSTYHNYLCTCQQNILLSQKSYDHLLFGQTLLIAQNCINWNVCSADQLVVFVLFFHFRLLKKNWCNRGFLWFWSFIIITDGSLAWISQYVKSVCFCNSFSVNLLWHSRLNVCLEIPHFAACT